MAFIGSFQVFDLVMMMTQGGRARDFGGGALPYQNAFKFFKMAMPARWPTCCSR